MVTRITTFSPIVNGGINAKFTVNPATTTGLTFGYNGGEYAFNGEVITVAAGTVTLTDDATNIVQLLAQGAVSAVTLGNETELPLYQVVTASGAITGITDLRAAIT